MNIRPNVELLANFPDDTVEDEHDIVEFPGRNITEALAAALSGLGYRVSEPIYAGEHGWELDFWWERQRMWMQITRMAGDECFLMTKNMASWLRPGLPIYKVFLSDLQRILEDDDRFSSIAWVVEQYWLDNAKQAAAGPFED